MRAKKAGELVSFESDNFSASGLVTHAFCTRNGGVSKSPFDSLNLSYRAGDKSDAVNGNYKIVGEKFGINHQHILTLNQSHGDGILIIDEPPENLGKFAIKIKNMGKDALITNKPLIPIAILTADCQPIMFLDKKNRAIGIAHAGWRGTVLRIGQKVFGEMSRLYGTSPDDLLVALGPSIGKCCYEVGEEVVEALKNQFLNWKDFAAQKPFMSQQDTKDNRNIPLSPSFNKDIIPLSPPLLKGDLGGFSERRKSKWNFSLDDLNLFQMAELGIPLKNISGTNLCTSCNNDLFFSYRREKGITGRLLSFVMLNEIKTKDQDPTQTNL